MKKVASESRNIRISCKKTDCDNDLHCYRPDLRSWKKPTGKCLSCGDESIDWSSIRTHVGIDEEKLIANLKKEWIRHYFWTIALDDRSQAKINTTTYDEMKEIIRERLATAVGIVKPFRDGTQTPIEGDKLVGHPEYYAQHATASCCKKCAYYWWGFSRDQAYTDVQLQFLVDRCMAYLHERGLKKSE